MKRLRDIASQFGTSKAVFPIDIDEHELHIGRFPLERYFPPKGTTSLDLLVASHYKEFFDIERRSFRVDPQAVANSAMNAVRGYFVAFLASRMQTKDPTKTKLYKWFRYSIFSLGEDFDEHMCDLYAYLVYIMDTQYSNKNYAAHVANALAIMEAVMVKYEKK